METVGLFYHLRDTCKMATWKQVELSQLKFITEIMFSPRKLLRTKVGGLDAFQEKAFLPGSEKLFLVPI